ncbi:hypothetical protein HanOQP8_Chr01g0027801 [Helianthus annuus]|nr:hypothetical protein HanOQP8_Chr01g0027801 [Helianthus annuus]
MMINNLLLSFFCRCFDIFTPHEQKILMKYRKENFANKKLVYSERRAIGKCPLTPEEVTFSFLFSQQIIKCAYRADGLVFLCFIFNGSDEL